VSSRLSFVSVELFGILQRRSAFASAKRSLAAITVPEALSIAVESNRGTVTPPSQAVRLWKIQ
jgi:hypothetical protein